MMNIVRPSTVFYKINALEVGGFISKENLGLQQIWIEARLSQIKKQLYPKEFKSVSKYLVRVK